MSLVRKIARPLLASMFVYGGIQSLLDPAARTTPAQKFTEFAAKLGADIPLQPVTLVRLDGSLNVAGGALLASRRFSRPAAVLLAAVLVPTTAFGHAYWTEQDPAKRAQQRGQFIKNLSMLGGLLLAAVDTGGQPGVVWRARHAREHVSAAGERAVHEAQLRAQLAAAQTRLRVHDLTS